ncbi:MAG: shikimate kinase [Spirochaetaceae bacterium]|jgi:shikimate kinase|nr:shikimate kinase [Spirochaetaceae bacterium]
MLILLTGPKHCGKSSLAPVLAALLGGTWADLDARLETMTGRSPRSLYRESPALFRQAEAAALAELLTGENPAGGSVVVAAGGGICDNGEALTLLKELRPFIVYLEISAATAWERILRGAESGGLPPFLEGEDPRETHRILHERRAALYRALADLSVPAESGSPEALAAAIRASLPHTPPP